MAKEDIPKRAFGGVPYRAVGDKRLSARDLRLLTLIAFHDQFSKNGQGCCIGQSKIRERMQCDYADVSRTAKRLVDYGYITAEKHPTNKRVRVYRVIYSDQDLAASKGAIVGKITNHSEGQTIGNAANDPGEIVGENANQVLEMVGTPNPDVTENIEELEQKILGET